jgi:hypothetical protein
MGVLFTELQVHSFKMCFAIECLYKLNDLTLEGMR